MSIKELKESLVGNKKEVKISYQGKEYLFYANEIGYLASQNIALLVQNDKNIAGFALWVAACIEDKDGNKFTYDEVLKLRKEIAEPLLEASLSFNKKETEEKK